MSTYETTAGLGDERVRILPRRGLIKNHYYTRATHGSWRLCGAIVVISWREVFFSGPPESYARMGRGGDTERCKSLTRDETFVSEASFLGPPKISDFWGEQRPWSPADLVERYRLCDSSAECECKITAKNWIKKR